MNSSKPGPIQRILSVPAVLPVLATAAVTALLLAGCNSGISPDPRDSLLAPADFPNIEVSVASLSEEQSLDGPSAQVELHGPEFRILQSLVLFENREAALSALDGIRADLANRGEASPGQPEASGIFEHQLGADQASSLFFIEGRGLVRLTVTGPNRQGLLEELTNVTRKKLSGS